MLRRSIGDPGFELGLVDGPEGGELRSTVCDERGTACGAIVYLVPRARGISAVTLPRLARCDGQGDAVFTRIRPGTYDVYAVTDDRASNEVEVSLVAGERASLDLVVEPGHAIAGTVVDRDGLPVANATVISATLSLHGDFTDAAGHFHLGGVPDSKRGTYLVSAKAPGSTWVLSSGRCQARPGDTALVITLRIPLS